MKRGFRNIWLLSILIIVISLIFSILTAYVERDLQPSFWNFEEIYWWWLVTISTVGYGDYVPRSPLGKALASVVIICSFIILGIVIAEVNYYIKLWTNKKSLGLVKFKHKGHIVILGNNALVNPIIKYLKNLDSKIDVVVITHKLEENPYESIDFVKGDPKSADSLIQANIKDSKIAIIVADETVNNPDAYTLVVANEIESINPDVLTIGEMIDPKYKTIFEHANIDYFISERALIKGIRNEDYIGKVLAKALEQM